MKKVMFVLGAILSVVACQKSNQPLPPDYYPLAVGNFWVYDMHRVDSVGNNLSPWKTDSTIIVSDTMIGSVQFFKKEHYIKYANCQSYSHMCTHFVRYTNDELVTSDGLTLFTLNGSRNGRVYMGSDSAHFVEHTVTVPNPNLNNQITVPAGSFPSIEEVTSYIEYDTSYVNPLMLQTTAYYSSRVGMLMKECFALSTLLSPNTLNPIRSLQRLRNYQVN